MDYKKRRQNLMAKMDDNSFLLFFNKRLNSDMTAFDVERNFYYFTGINEFDNILLIYKKHNVAKEILYLAPIDLNEEKWTGKKLRKEEAEQIANIKDVRYNNNTFMTELLELLDENSKIYFVVKEGEAFKYSYENNFALELANHKKVTITSSNEMIKSLRTIKDEDEIALIKEANEITNKGILNILKNLKPGLKEYQIESYFDQAIKYYGATGFSFPTIAASGINATCLHYNSNQGVLKDGDLILFDLGASLNTYCADVSRTFPVNGKFTELQKKIYTIVLNAQKMIENKARVGLTTKDLNQMVIEFYAKELKEIGLINKKEEVLKYYFHGVSHHIGMDCHDFCSYGPLEAGSIISNEPGLYIPEWNIGIRIEDDLLITNDKVINLSASIIKEIDDIEEVMRKR